MMPTTKSLRQGTAAALLAFVLMACGSDETATDAGASDDGDEAAATTVTDASDDNHGDEDHDEDGEDHGDEDDHDEDEDEDEDDHDDESSGGLGAHEHGTAELSVAWNDGDVVVDLITPTFNIFGFEYEPSTDDERALVTERTETIAEPGFIALNDEAGCELADDVETELEFEGSHAELTASWLFDCENPDEIRRLDLTELFAEFPNFEDIDAQWASPTAQSAAELSPASTVLSLE